MLNPKYLSKNKGYLNLLKCSFKQLISVIHQFYSFWFTANKSVKTPNFESPHPAAVSTFVLILVANQQALLSGIEARLGELMGDAGGETALRVMQSLLVERCYKLMGDCSKQVKAQ